MSLHPIDLGILVVYFAAMIVVGFVLEKRASRGLDSYFLGSNRMPWWLLSMSNAASMFDISGTMWLVYLLFLYGLKSVFFPWLWPVFNQIFLMVYLSAWLRRSNALTGGDWITLRFGGARGAELARVSVVFFALVSVIGFTSYAFIGIGKFAAVFLPAGPPPEAYGLIVVAITTLYTVVGGLYSVVVTDLIQFVIMTIGCLAIAWIAMTEVSPELLATKIPPGWDDIGFGWRLDLDWASVMPAADRAIAGDHDLFGSLTSSTGTLFGAFFLAMTLKGVLVSMAGPAPNYDMQRVLAAKDPRQAALMSASVSLVLNLPRYLMVAGITVLALAFMSDSVIDAGGRPDFEVVLPIVIRDFLPVGIEGLLLAGLLAAFMSTFSGTINAGAAYLVNDVYRRYLRPDASERSYVRASYVASALIVIAGCLAGYYAESVASLAQWIVSALAGGYALPNILKWHWWRMNGHGYFCGMLGGVLGALLVAALDFRPFDAFPLLMLVSGLAAILGSLLTPAQDAATLDAFYLRTRPWGLWGPVRQRVARNQPDFRENRELARDAVNIVLGVIWQTALIALPIYVVIRKPGGIIVSAILVVLCMAVLKKTWYDRLERKGSGAEA